MKTKANKTTQNWVEPGGSISTNDFRKGITKAEKGPFYSVDEAKKIAKSGRQSNTQRKGL